MVTGTPFVVVYDANVLFPATIRDTLLRVASAGLVQAKWTNEIHEEWIRNLLRKKPQLDAAKLERTRKLMDDSVRDCLVDGYEALIPSLDLPDPDDRHVLAAAIKSGAQTIVTLNEKDFPPTELRKFGISTETPDAFVVGLIDIDPHAVAVALRKQRDALTNPPFTPEEFLENLARAGLAETVKVIRPEFLRLGA